MKKIKLEEDWGNIEEFKESMSDKCLSVWNMFTENHADSGYNDLLTWGYILEKFGITFEISMCSTAYDFEITLL